MKYESNLLPYDGEAYLSTPIVAQASAKKYLERLTTSTPWQHDEVVMFGRVIKTKRQVAWYGDTGMDYSYAGRRKVALPWTDLLSELKALVEAKSSVCYNACLLNYYQDGTQSMGWHRDDEKELKKEGVIASLSFGAERRFLFRHMVTKDKVEVRLADASLLLMMGSVQKHWQHSLPPMRGVLLPRINLTFRTICS